MGGSDKDSDLILDRGRTEVSRWRPKGDQPDTEAAMRLVPGPGGNPALDRLAGLAARLLGVPSAQVSLLTSEQVIAGGAGLTTDAVGSSSPLDGSLCTATVASGSVLVVGDAAGDDRVAALEPVTSGAVAAYLGVPLVTSAGATVGALCVFDTRPHRWSAYDVGVVEGLAGSVMAELELSALSAEFEFGRLRWDAASEAAEIGSFDVDLVSGRLAMDERMRAIYGFPSGQDDVSRAEALERVHPDDRPTATAAFSSAIEARGDYRVEYRVVHPDGALRWVSVRSRVRSGQDDVPVQLIGAAYDITESRTAGDRAASLLATMATGFLAVDRGWRITYVNAAGERIAGKSVDELVGEVLWKVFPLLEESEFGPTYHRAMRTGEAADIEAYYADLDRWYEVRAEPTVDGLAFYFIDITSRYLAQQEAETAREAAEVARSRADAMREEAEKAAARLALLASVSAELADDLEAEKAVARLAQLVVPALADWSIVTLVDDEGRMRDVGWWHVDPELRPLVERFAGARFDNRFSQGPVQEARDLRQPVITGRGVMERAAESLRSPEALDAISQLAPESSAALPLIARNRVVGVLSLCRGSNRPPMSAEAISTARQVADRAAVALDNARLYDEQRTLAEGLQRSLLTPPPEPDHLQIVVRYEPAAARAAVGGDWYDSFVQPDGATMLVIGDVIGHDTEAAAAMGQLRGLLRGIAWSTGTSPAEVLSSVDAANVSLQLDTSASAVIARLEQTDDQMKRGLRTLRWSNAGHPPPFVLQPGIPVATLAAVGPQLLLGVDPHTERSDATVVLLPGSTVVFYTDGLIERHDQGLEDGLERLRAALEELRELALDDLCDQLLARLLPDRAGDDVALLAVRLHPELPPTPV